MDGRVLRGEAAEQDPRDPGHEPHRTEQAAKPAKPGRSPIPSEGGEGFPSSGPDDGGWGEPGQTKKEQGCGGEGGPQHIADDLMKKNDGGILMDVRGGGRWSLKETDEV